MSGKLLSGNLDTICYRLRESYGVTLRPGSDSSRRVVTAAHEAGHCVVSLCLGVGVERTTVRQTALTGPRFGGAVVHNPRDLSEQPPATASDLNGTKRRVWAQKVAAIALAGELAEELLDPAIRRHGAGSSAGDAPLIEAARAAAPELDLADVARDVRAMLRRHDDDVDSVATALLIRGELDAVGIARVAPAAYTTYQQIWRVHDEYERLSPQGFARLYPAMAVRHQARSAARS